MLQDTEGGASYGKILRGVHATARMQEELATARIYMRMHATARELIIIVSCGGCNKESHYIREVAHGRLPSSSLLVVWSLERGTARPPLHRTARESPTLPTTT